MTEVRRVVYSLVVICWPSQRDGGRRPGPGRRRRLPGPRPSIMYSWRRPAGGRAGPVARGGGGLSLTVPAWQTRAPIESPCQAGRAAALPAVALSLALAGWQ